MSAPPASKKMLKMMGLQVKDLLSSCFKIPEGSVTRQEHGMFWQQVSTVKSKEALEFLSQVFEQLKATIEKKSPGVGTSSLVNTVAFIMFFLQLDMQNTIIKTFLRDWKKSRDAWTKAFPPVREVVRTMQLLADGTDIVGPLVIAGSTLHTVEEFQQLSAFATVPAYEDSDITSGENAFIYHYLSRLCSNPTAKQNIIKHILSKMMTLSQQMKSSPIVAQTTLLALLLMLKSILAKEPVDFSLIKRAIVTVQPFYLWPKPYGTAAREVLELLQMELLSPGHAMRTHLTKEAMGVDKGQTLLYFVDSESNRSLSFVHTMEMVAYAEKRKSARKEPKNPLNPLTQALAIMSLMAQEPSVGLTPADIEMFKQLNRDTVVPLYEKFETYADNVPKNFQVAKQARIDTLLAIKAELKKITATPGDGIPLNFSEKLDSFVPPPLEVDHVAVSSKLNYTYETHQNLKLMCLKFMPYPGSEVFEKYFQILTAYHSKARDKKLTLRLFLAGGDRLLHFFLCAHMRILQTEPQLLKGLDVRFFVVPFENNSLAGFLARQDSWYNRHIFIPFRSKAFILPGVRVDGGGSGPESKEAVEISAPGQFYRDTMLHYALESRFRWEINVYQVDCWEAKKEEKLADPAGLDGATPAASTDSETALLPDYSIPFISGVEVGVNAYAQDFLEGKKELDQTMKPEDVAKEKDFNFVPPVVALNFTKVDLNGRTQKITVEEAIPYENIVVANIPKKQEKRVFPPDPTAPWLEMFARPKNPSASKKNVIVSEPRQHIVALEANASEGGAFEVLIDGQVFKSLKKIVISRVYTVEGAKKSKIWNSMESGGKPKGSPVVFHVEGFFPSQD